MLIKLSAWSCLEIRMQDEVRISGLKIDFLKGLKSSNQNSVMKKLRAG